CPARVAKRARVYAVAAAIESAASRRQITRSQMEHFNFVTCHWLKHKHPETERRDCLTALEYQKLFPSKETYAYVVRNPKKAELVAAFMLALNASNAGEKKLTIGAVRNEWHKIVGQKLVHGKPRYYIDENDCFLLNRSDLSRASFYRRFSKNFIRQAAQEAARKLEYSSVGFEG